MCTKVNQQDFLTIHHEMGHIEYYMQYTDQPYIFRSAANPGFHESIGDALALSVSTSKHLQCKLGLDMGAPIDCDSEYAPKPSPQNIIETDINYLYTQALNKLAFFPFAISMDSWRWAVFEGTIPEEEFNKRWWEIFEANQGIVPPSPRNSTEGLEAAAKYHIVSNVEYIRYFLSYILQFQFYEALCVEAGEFSREDPLTRPLYHCDFSGSKEAGKLFGDMMKLGFSEPRPVALKRTTGSMKVTVDPLLRYFKPLLDYLEQQLADNGETPGFECNKDD